jgi:hypothetical protein
MNRQASYCAFITIALIQCLTLAMPGRASAAEPAWWTQQKAQCGLSPGLAYNDWDGHCNSSSGAAPAMGGGGVTPQQQMILNGAQMMMPVLQQGVHDMFYGNPEEEARQAQAAEQQRRADEQRMAEVRRAQQEAMRQQELRKQKLLSELKDSEPSTDLGLKLGDSHPPLVIKEGAGAFGTGAVIPVGLGSPAKGGLQLKLGDDADRSSGQAGQGFDSDGKILESNLPPPPPTPTSITPTEKSHMLDVLNSSLKKNQAEQQTLKAQLATLQQTPSADPAAVNHAQEQLTAATAANEDLKQKISNTEKISVSVDLGDTTPGQTSAQ